MPKSSRYLLLVDGSRESLAAANVCTTLAKRSGASVTALHVVDTSLARQVIGYSGPGVVGSGPYVAAYEEIRQSMRRLGDTIMEAYRSKFSELITGADSIVIEEGVPSEIIQRLYLDYDLIVAGHRNLAARQPGLGSLCQALVRDGQRPLLLVQNEVQNPSRLRLVLGDGVPSNDCLHALLKFADQTKFARDFVWAGSAPGFDAYATLLKEMIPPANISPIYLTDPVIDEEWCQVLQEQDVMPVIFCRKQLGGRVTLQRAETTDLLLDRPFSAVLLWPVEFTGHRQDNAKSARLSYSARL